LGLPTQVAGLPTGRTGEEPLVMLGKKPSTANLAHVMPNRHPDGKRWRKPKLGGCLPVVRVAGGVAFEVDDRPEPLEVDE
jgi:hypothetical protein